MHEVAVLSRGDLAAGRGQEGARWGQGTLRTPLSIPLCSQPAATVLPSPEGSVPSLSPQARLWTLVGHCGRGQMGGAKPGAPFATTHLPLVPMQQGLPLISQSRWAKPVWLVLVS